MTTLATIRDRVRKDLRDTDSNNQRWDDSLLDRHIARALRDLSLAVPRERAADVPTTPGSPTISIASLDDRIAIERATYPAGAAPARSLHFTTWDDEQTVTDEIRLDGSDLRIAYTASHTLDEAGSTLPPALEDILATGASGYAAVELAGYTVDRLTTSGTASRDYAAWGQAWLVAFRQLLHHHGRSRRVKQSRLRPAG